MKKSSCKIKTAHFKIATDQSDCPPKSATELIVGNVHYVIIEKPTVIKQRERMIFSGKSDTNMI